MHVLRPAHPAPPSPHRPSPQRPIHTGGLIRSLRRGRERNYGHSCGLRSDLLYPQSTVLDRIRNICERDDSRASRGSTDPIAGDRRLLANMPQFFRSESGH